MELEERDQEDERYPGSHAPEAEGRKTYLGLECSISGQTGGRQCSHECGWATINRARLYQDSISVYQKFQFYCAASLCVKSK